MILIVDLLGVRDRVRVRVGAMDKGLGWGCHEWERGRLPGIHRMQVHLPLGLDTTLVMVSVRVCIRARVRVRVRVRIRVSVRVRVRVRVRVTIGGRFGVRVTVWRRLRDRVREGGVWVGVRGRVEVRLDLRWGLGRGLVWG